MIKYYVAFWLVLLALYGIVSRSDYEDEKANELLYCKNVRDGIWPDYKEIKNICKKLLTNNK